MRIKDDNFFTVQGWMITQLELKGIDLMVYAILYGFTQDGESEFRGSVQYLCDFCGGVTKPTVTNALNRLIESGLIEKESDDRNGLILNSYKVILPLVKNLSDKNICKTSKEILQGSKKIISGGKNSLPNNKKDKETICKKDNKNTSDSDFAELWKLYPRHEAKKAAHTAYLKAIKNGYTVEQIKKGITAYKLHIEREKIKPKYIKMFSTWLNGECWNDDYGQQAVGMYQDDDLDHVFGGG